MNKFLFTDGYLRVNDTESRLGVRIKESSFRAGTPISIRLNSGHEVWDITPEQARTLAHDLKHACLVFDAVSQQAFENGDKR